MRLLPRSELLRYEQDDLFIPFTLRGLASHCAVTTADRLWHWRQNRETVKRMVGVEKQFDELRKAPPEAREKRETDGQTFGLEKTARMAVAVEHFDAVLKRYEGREDAPLGLAALRHTRDLLAEAGVWARVSADVSPMVDELGAQYKRFGIEAKAKDAHPVYAALAEQARGLMGGLNHAYTAASTYQDAASAAYTDALSATTRTELDERAFELDRQAATEGLAWTNKAKLAIADWRQSVRQTLPQMSTQAHASTNSLPVAAGLVGPRRAAVREWGHAASANPESTKQLSAVAGIGLTDIHKRTTAVDKTPPPLATEHADRNLPARVAVTPTGATSTDTRPTEGKTAWKSLELG